jgi:hypothetical protein
MDKSVYEMLNDIISRIHIDCNGVNGMKTKLASHIEDASKIDMRLGNNKATVRLSKTILEVSENLKSLHSLCVRTRKEIISINKGKKALRSQE